MELHYYDPMFYISSEKMQFVICIETELEEPVDGEALTYAMNEAIRRYRYFSIRVVKQNEELIPEYNPLPIVAYPGPTVYDLGGEEVNYHMLSASYSGNRIHFYATHVFTDGNGFFPFLKTVLYYYLCRRYGTVLDPKGISLSSDPLFDDELGNPYPEEKMRYAEPLYSSKPENYFRLTDGGLITDGTPTVFRFDLDESEVMRFSHDNDGSPCALLSSLMAKAIWSVHPENTKDIVSAISFNLRPGLGNRHSYRMLCSALKLKYPYRLHEADVTKLCTCSRGMVTLQSQPENVLYYAQKTKERLEKLLEIRGLDEKKRIFGQLALEDSVSNTFSVSYVGKIDMGSLGPHIRSMYNLTDGSTFQTVFIEVSAMNGKFNISLIQGFSTDVYYRAFLKMLDQYDIKYQEMASSPMVLPKTILP